MAAVLVILGVAIGTAAALSGGGESSDESEKSTATVSEEPSVTSAPTVARSGAAEVIGILFQRRCPVQLISGLLEEYRRAFEVVIP
ncbi:hypothetical protein GCM10010160_62950 [Acrocarpospora corrugata]